jgi:hypothetical protein
MSEDREVSSTSNGISLTQYVLRVVGFVGVVLVLLVPIGGVGKEQLCYYSVKYSVDDAVFQEILSQNGGSPFERGKDGQPDKCWDTVKDPPNSW